MLSAAQSVLGDRDVEMGSACLGALALHERHIHPHVQLCRTGAALLLHGSGQHQCVFWKRGNAPAHRMVEPRNRRRSGLGLLALCTS